MNENIGQHWVLLRGLIRESGHWGDFIPLLKDAFPESRISLLDLPGTGIRHHEISPSRISEIVDSLREQAHKQGLLKQPITFLALSLGGMVAWEWMKHYPQDVNGGCLINISLADCSPFYHRLRWQSLAKLFAVVMQADVDKRETAILQLISNGDQDQRIAESWADIAKLRPINSRTKINQLLAAARYKPGLQKPAAPVLLLQSQDDQLVASACSDEIHRKLQLPLVSHPGAGHDLPLDDGVWVIAQLQTWLSDLSHRKT